MSMNIPMPPTLQGSEGAQLVQMHRYLFALSEQLNAAAVAQEKVTKAAETAARTANQAVSEDVSAQSQSLKALIIKTADIVRSEMDVLETQLNSRYIAKSEWGVYEENITANIRATAAQIVEAYEYDARIDSLKEQAADFDAWRLTTSGYIQRGIIGYDDGGTPIIGIAIGQDLRSAEVTVNGEILPEIDMKRNLATYTSEKVTFWQNGTATGEFSNGRLWTRRIEVDQSIVLGGKWEIGRANGFTVKWIGG